MKKYLGMICFILFLALLAGCSSQRQEGNNPNAITENPQVILATTTSTNDSGLLDVLLPAFEKKWGYKVDVISQGTGQALKTGELGDCDVVLVHARDAEDRFVEQGFGVNRRDVMYNDFVLLGPPHDPAQIKGLDIVSALSQISQLGNIPFLSRGDNSGTHKKELELWQSGGIVPQGSWYLDVNKGMGDTLVMASEIQGYTLADRGTYISMYDRLNLHILIEGDNQLLNPYGVIAVNPDKHPNANYKGAQALIEFITSKEGKEIINNFTINGQQLFFAQ